MRQVIGSLVLLVSLVHPGCHAPVRLDQVDGLLQRGVEAARRHVEAGRDREAYQLTTAIARIDPEFPGLDELEMDEAAISIDRGWLGSNVAYRTPDRSPWWAQILWYLPDRVLDVFDIISFDVHVGFGVYVDVHATRWLGASLGYRAVAGLGWHDQRSLGGQVRAETTASLMPFGVAAGTMARAGSSGARGFQGASGGLVKPSLPRFQEYDDFWAVGAAVTAGVAGVDVDVHPIEIFDLLVGFVLFDPLHDDFAASDGLAVSRQEWALIRDMLRVASDEEQLAAYRDSHADRQPR